MPIPAFSRSLWLGFHSSDGCGYHFRSKPAPQRLRIPLSLGMLAQQAGSSIRPPAAGKKAAPGGAAKVAEE